MTKEEKRNAVLALSKEINDLEKELETAREKLDAFISGKPSATNSQKVVKVATKKTSKKKKSSKKKSQSKRGNGISRRTKTGRLSRNRTPAEREFDLLATLATKGEEGLSMTNSRSVYGASWEKEFNKAVRRLKKEGKITQKKKATGNALFIKSSAQRVLSQAEARI